MKLKYFLLILIVVIAFFLRFFKLGEIPAGIHQDEESHGYNAFSLLKTGGDRYGEKFPILFRSFGSYQPPVYTYLAIVPVGLFGNTTASVRSVSAVLGTILVLVTYFFVLEFFDTKEKHCLALIAALVIAISPWAVYFSRLVAEGNLGVTFFALSFLLFILSLKKAWLFPLATLTLGISTHAYYSERVIAVLFLPVFVYLYRNYLWNKKRKWLLTGIFVFVVVMIPHLLILTTGAFTRRLAQVGYIGNQPFLVEFLRRYLIYFDPRNIFFDLGSALGRMPPNLGVFYTIFVIPFFVGLIHLKEFIKKEFIHLYIFLVAILPIAAALTGDDYYPLRVLSLLWIIGMIVSVGAFVILNSIKNKRWRLLILAAVIVQSLFSLYISYFILFKYERAKDYANSSVIFISDYLKKYNGYKILFDSARNPGVGLRIAYLTRYDPLDLQKKLRAQLKTPYYSGDVSLYEDYLMGAIEFKNLDWGEVDCTPKLLVVGDTLSISNSQAKDHNLKFEFEIKDISGYDGLVAYSTNPQRKCQDPSR